MCGPDKYANIFRWRKCAFGRSVFTGIHKFRDFSHSSAAGRTLVNLQTQPTVPTFHHASRGNSKAGTT